MRDAKAEAREWARECALIFAEKIAADIYDVPAIETREEFKAAMVAVFESCQERAVQAEQSRAMNAKLLDELYPRLVQAEQERDAARKRYKTLCDAVNDGLTCDDKPNNTCSSYGHDEDCPGISTEITLLKYAGDLKALHTIASELAGALGTEHNPEVCQSLRTFGRCRTCDALSAYQQHEKGKG